MGERLNYMYNIEALSEKALQRALWDDLTLGANYFSIDTIISCRITTEEWKFEQIKSLMILYNHM